MEKIAVFASGEGTNLQALLDACADGRVRGTIALVVSNKPGVGALKRAARAGVETLVAAPAESASPDEYAALLAHECKKRGVGLICLAGFMLKVRPPLLKAYAGRMMNIHPALLPAFGGQGMYGMKVHESVLASGVKVSGPTVHIVDEDYDHGPIVLQAAVPVLAGDTPASLAARVRAQEHWIYPKAVALFCEGRLKVEGSRVDLLPSVLDDSPRARRALLSVSDKTGLVEFAKGLNDLGIELVSTSGTAKALIEAGVPVRPLDTMTGFPEILDGRVKTLHPHVHGAILLRRKDPKQAREADLFGIEPIDLVVVNLYPFAKTVAAAPSAYDQNVIEQIDIGGVALIRAAAKNFEDVAVLTSPADYAATLAELAASQGRLGEATRKKLALTAFKHTADYDSMIARAWTNGSGGAAPEVSESGTFPPVLNGKLTKVQDLRYGENPHQKAALYANEAGMSFTQLHGKELSYNNLLDASGTWDAVSDFEDPTAVIFKHVTPAGIGSGSTIEAALDRAWACDPLSAFGGVLAFNRPVTRAIAETLSKRFVEVLVAPGYDPEALEILKKKPNVRLLVRTKPPTKALQLRSIGDEVLVTEPDRLISGAEWKVVTKRAPRPAEEAAMRFAWTAAKHVKSNAIVLAGPEQTVGIGAGQMSRVDSVHMSGVKLKLFLRDNEGPAALVLASDAFFPFRDGIDAAATLGISAIVCPGGSVKDAEVIAAADEHSLAMVFTGMRHFRH
ncbi:MAG TPA: bifunctional phosphoribosylaminoimidazolecarboxamide formyltransferase/IMP cyclohydrolase [Elusimicrobiota bacterium]|nr:bifunctional phosphoribosylaminoimidazolecarboxamide formyltransferase/IMP cyclohydrolase [Elusimicrobiota bacterium]